MPSGLPAVPQRLEDSERASNGSGMSRTSSEEGEGDWFPGDGVCPSSSDFSAVYNTTLSFWTDRAHEAGPAYDGADLFHIEPLLVMLQDVPELFENAPPDVEIRGEGRAALTLRPELHLITTDYADCDQREKEIVCHQVLATSKPATFRIMKSEEETSFHQSSTVSSDAAANLTNISLAWSYIISCVWVEALQCQGQKCSMKHPDGAEIPDVFWDLVTEGRWEARVQNRMRIFYCPWMLRQNGWVSQEILIDVSPNSSLAFDILVEYCMTNHLEEELILGLATVLQLRLTDVRQLELPTPAALSNRGASLNKRSMSLDRLFRSLGKCIQLSSTHEALDSLLCSVFFDPTVTCNFRGAMTLGIRDALPNEDNWRVMLKAISSKAPHIAPFWNALVRNGQAQDMLDCALSGLPPICLPAALWTNTIQSFLQVNYTCDPPQDTISRAREFSTSCFVRPHASIPWSPAPPFGSTSLDNLSLVVREHIGHQHKPLRWTMFWTSKSGEKMVAGRPNHPKPPPSIILARAQMDFSTESRDQSWNTRERDANDRSWDATSRLFNWHRDYDDGLWMADATRPDIESIRRLQQHPWIADPWDDGGRYSPVLQQNRQSKLDTEMIWQWVNKID